MGNPELAELGGSRHADYSRFSRCISCKINYPKGQVFCSKCDVRLRHAARGLKWKVEHKRIE